jgi:hypothetical protein
MGTVTKTSDPKVSNFEVPKATLECDDVKIPRESLIAGNKNYYILRFLYDESERKDFKAKKAAEDGVNNGDETEEEPETAKEKDKKADFSSLDPNDFDYSSFGEDFFDEDVKEGEGKEKEGEGEK